MSTKGMTFRRQPLDAERRAKFLEVLEATGSFSFAASQASPYSKYPSSCLATFRSLVARDPNFAALVERAQIEADHKILSEAHRRAIHGTLKPIFQGGRRMKMIDPATGKKVDATETVFSDRLLEVLLRGKFKEYGKHVSHEHSGTITHAAFAISEDELRVLSPEQRAAFRSIVLTLAEHRAEKPKEPAQVTEYDATVRRIAAPSEYTDAEFEVVHEPERETNPEPVESTAQAAPKKKHKHSAAVEALARIKNASKPRPDPFIRDEKGRITGRTKNPDKCAPNAEPHKPSWWEQ